MRRHRHSIVRRQGGPIREPADDAVPHATAAGGDRLVLQLYLRDDGGICVWQASIGQPHMPMLLAASASLAAQVAPNIDHRTGAYSRAARGIERPVNDVALGQS